MEIQSDIMLRFLARRTIRRSAWFSVGGAWPWSIRAAWSRSTRAWTVILGTSVTGSSATAAADTSAKAAAIETSAIEAAAIEAAIEAALSAPAKAALSASAKAALAHAAHSHVDPNRSGGERAVISYLAEANHPVADFNAAERQRGVLCHFRGRVQFQCHRHRATERNY